MSEPCGENVDAGVSTLGYRALSAIGIASAELLSLCGRLEEARAALDEGLVAAREHAEAEWIAWTLSAYPLLACSAGGARGDRAGG